MIQFHHFHTGGFVLHRVPVGQSTYSAPFYRRTKPITERMTKMRAELERVARRYTAEANRLADHDHPGGPLATAFDPPVTQSAH